MTVLTAVCLSTPALTAASVGTSAVGSVLITLQKMSLTANTQRLKVTLVPFGCILKNALTHHAVLILAPVKHSVRRGPHVFVKD